MRHQSTCSIDGCETWGIITLGYCQRHYQRALKYGDPHGKHQPPTTEQRFWSKVNKDGPVPEHRPELGRCWLWTDYLNPAGYGQFKQTEKRGPSLAHRYSHELHIGPIPPGLVVHHECENPACVNPGHLKAMDRGEHSLIGDSPLAREARQTHCKRGHEFDTENTLYTSRGFRQCRTCLHAKSLARYQKHRA